MSDKMLLEAVLRDGDRLEALRRTGLLDTPAEEEFDRLTRLVCRLLGVPAALVSLVEAERQFFKSAVGLPQPWLLRRETSLLHSFCQHVVAAGAPLLVQDASTHPIVSGNLAVPDLGVMAYLGMPLTTPDGHVLGALCAIDTEPRAWTPGDAAALRDLATVTMSEVTLRRLALEIAERARQDAVEHAATQARTRRLETLRQLTNDVAHDLAGVLQAVQSGMRLVAGRLESDPMTVRSLVALLDDVVGRGGDLTASLLAFTPRGELRPAQVGVEALLRQLARVLASAPGVPLQVRVEAEAQLPPVLVDPDELRSVLQGLAKDARRAMSEGGMLTLGAAVDDVASGAAHPARLRAGRYVRLSVADTGTGLDGRGRVDAKASPEVTRWSWPSTELALTLARCCAEQAGGGLVRDCRPGVGSTVALWLPVIETDGVTAEVSTDGQEG